MENKTKDIKDATIEEIKSSAFDAKMLIEGKQMYLNMLIEELERRANDGVTAQAPEDVPVINKEDGKGK